MAKERAADRARANESASLRGQLECNAAISEATGRLIGALVDVQNGVANTLALLTGGDGAAAQRALADFGSSADRLAAAQAHYAAAMQRVGEVLVLAGGASKKLN